nr:XtrA/YqaO family protein [Sporolactobacillus shoreae]
MNLNFDGKSVTEKMESSKVLMVVLDSGQNKAVEHGFTIIKTANGKVAKVKYSERSLF